MAAADSPARPGAAAGGAGRSGRAGRWFASFWWRASPSPAARLLQPLSWLYRALAAIARAAAPAPAATPVPVLVVGNFVVGGAGKTPVVIALVRALQAAGRRPGVISRGHGRAGAGVYEAGTDSPPQRSGDEPLLIRRRTGVPVFVGRRRAEAAAALCARHAQVDVLVSDDGLQHHALARVGEIVVFDDRGAGNGLLLPAGPLRQPLPRALPRNAFVLYSGERTSTPLPGMVVPRRRDAVVPLAAWARGEAAAAQPLASLRGRRVTALAGIGAPEQFFRMLEAAGLDIERLPCADHADYPQWPWPGRTREVVTTEKDAVKLALLLPAPVPVWVLPLDCDLPPPLVSALLALLPPVR
ncbi:MAG: tetraacyldisaccharide 4'-kinase [Rubrivivax sp.]|nr:tetraacyldisaccharide 4'-kinase [Rubrivivax sp.]